MSQQLTAPYEQREITYTVKKKPMLLRPGGVQCGYVKELTKRRY